MAEKNRITPCKTTLTRKDGTKYVYIQQKSRHVKGIVLPDNTVGKFTKEQILDMQQRRKDGVTITRLASDYNTAVNTIKKYLAKDTTGWLEDKKADEAAPVAEVVN